MDEAMSSVKLKSISKPVELDVLEKEIRTLKIELEAKKSEKETPKETIKNLETKIEKKECKAKDIEKTWKVEKNIIGSIKANREKIDKLKLHATNYERE
jgi:ATP-dependent Clp protease ATP-binding subunit ClpB